MRQHHGDEIGLKSSWKFSPYIRVMTRFNGGQEDPQQPGRLSQNINLLVEVWINKAHGGKKKLQTQIREQQFPTTSARASQPWAGLKWGFLALWVWMWLEAPAEADQGSSPHSGGQHMQT